MGNLSNSTKHRGKGAKWQDASELNRSYQQALMAILDTIDKPSDETRLAVLKAEDIAFKVEQQIGKEFRKPPTINRQCVHGLECVHYKIE